MEKIKVFVSGCFDILHPGHIVFLNRAKEYGDELYVSVANDKCLEILKNKWPVFKENDRLKIISELKAVDHAFIAKGFGILDFEEDLKEIKPDIFIVNDDGDYNKKKKLCESLGIKYIVLEKGNILHSSTLSRKKINIPYRLELGGGWLDQPFVSKNYPGPVLTISIHPDERFITRSGLGTSTRERAIELWKDRIPDDDFEKLAKILFSFDNIPGKEFISGSQDAIGIVFPGLNYLFYNGDYWPEKIITVKNDEIFDWLEKIIYLIPLKPRDDNFKVLEKTNITKENVKELSDATENIYKAILSKDIDSLGKYFADCFDSHIKIFPNMSNDHIFKVLEKYKKNVKGWKVSGAGGGGYLILVSDKEIPDSIKIKIRRE
ncbi:MAG: adenylyltransferase/cytidyltransferase family protein [archaeon]